jgi:hypothetical protein
MLSRSLLAALLAALAGVYVLAQSPPTPVFKFAVSGDSRNCGDVVMPAIAASVLKSGASFYWHLGDFRAIYDFDEDMAPPARLGLNAPHLTILNYLQQAWPDFISRQLTPFGSLEVFLGIGNHEIVYPKTHAEWIEQFGRYLNTPRLRTQRRNDRDLAGGPRSYFHWVMNDVDFLSLDNATGSAFDAGQMAWIRRRLAADQRSRSITTVVVGMHEALPGSKGMSHSMCDAPAGVESGRAVYKLLWALEQSGKKVYVLASHSHFVMDDIYNTAYWKDQVLPGWIVGTAGAVRYRLPAGVPTATIARTDVYGYLLATVMSDGSIHFDFHETGLDELRQANQGKTPEPLIRWCYAENSDQRIPAPEACGAGGR